MILVYRLGQFSVMMRNHNQKFIETQQSPVDHKEKTVTIEKINDTYYAFTDNNEFISQNRDYSKLLTNVKEKFSHNKSLTIVNKF